LKKPGSTAAGMVVKKKQKNKKPRHKTGGLKKKLHRVTPAEIQNAKKG